MNKIVVFSLLLLLIQSQNTGESQVSAHLTIATGSTEV